MNSGANQKLSESLLEELSVWVGEKLGLDFPESRRRDLGRAVRAAVLERGEEERRYVRRLLDSPEWCPDGQLLANHLTVGETYFFRYPESLEAVGRKIQSQEITGTFRIWSAGCSTGEEPYSIAILAKRSFPERQISITGTDLNALSLEKASKGVYGKWSFRTTPQWMRSRYFSQVDKHLWSVDPGVRKAVNFARVNLVDSCLPPATQGMDMILCRNVLMYLRPTAASRAIRNLHQALNPGGWLLVSPVEISHSLFSLFTPVRSGPVLFYQKDRHEFRSPVTIGPEAGLPRETSEKQPEQESSEPVRNSLLSLAESCGNRGELNAGLGLCDRAIAAGDASPRAHYLRAAILEEQGALEDAARSLRRALYLDPDFTMAHFASGHLAMRRGRVEESYKHFENTLGLLASFQEHEVIPEGDGLSAGQLRKLVCLRKR
jgi:chemotaxis protein methyltransferase CheR